MNEIDALDRKILHGLDMNGRAAYSEMGKKLRISKERVRYRIERLEKEGIITGYYAVVDLAKLGLLQFRVYLKLESLGKKGSEELIGWLVKRDDVWFVGEVSGNFHIALGMYAKSIWGFQKFWNELMEKYGSVIGWYLVSPMTSYTEFSRDYLLENEKTHARKEFTTFRECEQVPADEIDLRILRALGKNARTSLDSIARKLGVSLMVVRYRVKKLKEQGVLLGYRALFDHGKLGYEYYKVDVLLGERKHATQLKKFILGNPNVAYTEETIQGSDFEFDVHVKGLGQLLGIMEEARGRFGKAIKQYGYYNMVKIHKSEYLPAGL
jgi:DNA-binding Lrp family transcriptional regulator